MSYEEEDTYIHTQVPFITVVTDLGSASTLWFHKGVDKCVVPGMYPPPHMTCTYPPPHMTCMYPPPNKAKRSLARWQPRTKGSCMSPYPKREPGDWMHTYDMHVSSSTYDMHVIYLVRGARRRLRKDCFSKGVEGTPGRQTKNQRIPMEQHGNSLWAQASETRVTACSRRMNSATIKIYIYIYSRKQI
jgi:hypothetical protein